MYIRVEWAASVTLLPRQTPGMHNIVCGLSDFLAEQPPGKHAARGELVAEETLAKS